MAKSFLATWRPAGGVVRVVIVEEPDGRIGTVCVYQATDVASIHEHAQRAQIAADEIVPVLNTVVVRQDPA